MPSVLQQIKYFVHRSTVNAWASFIINVLLFKLMNDDEQICISVPLYLTLAPVPSIPPCFFAEWLQTLAVAPPCQCTARKKMKKKCVKSWKKESRQQAAGSRQHAAWKSLCFPKRFPGGQSYELIAHSCNTLGSRVEQSQRRIIIAPIVGLLLNHHAWCVCVLCTKKKVRTCWNTKTHIRSVTAWPLLWKTRRKVLGGHAEHSIGNTLRPTALGWGHYRSCVHINIHTHTHTS